jgi:hypothetical protein
LKSYLRRNQYLTIFHINQHRFKHPTQVQKHPHSITNQFPGDWFDTTSTHYGLVGWFSSKNKKIGFDKFLGTHLPQTFEQTCGSRVWVTGFRITITGRATMNWIFGWTHYELIVLHCSKHIVTAHTGIGWWVTFSDKRHKSFRVFEVLFREKKT